MVWNKEDAIKKVPYLHWNNQLYKSKNRNELTKQQYWKKTPVRHSEPKPKWMKNTVLKGKRYLSGWTRN